MAQLATKLHEHVAEYKCQPRPDYAHIKYQKGTPIIPARPACKINWHVLYLQPYSVLFLPDLDACMILVSIHLKDSVDELHDLVKQVQICVRDIGVQACKVTGSQ